MNTAISCVRIVGVHRDSTDREEDGGGENSERTRERENQRTREGTTSGWEERPLLRRQKLCEHDLDSVELVGHQRRRGSDGPQHTKVSQLSCKGRLAVSR